MAIAIDDFLKIDIRLGTIVEAGINEGARKRALKLVVDFGPELGLKKSSAQIAAHYAPADLIGRKVAAVVNFPPRQIARTVSEVLVLGFSDAGGDIVLIGVDREVPNGSRLH